MPDRLRIAPTAAEIGLKPADVAELPLEALPGLLAALAALQGAVAARLAVVPARNGERPADAESGRNTDRLLTVAQLAERLGQDRRYVYRRARSPDWDFTVKDGKRLMFSERGFAAWIERNRVQP